MTPNEKLHRINDVLKKVEMELKELTNPVYQDKPLFEFKLGQDVVIKDSGERVRVIDRRYEEDARRQITIYRVTAKRMPVEFEESELDDANEHSLTNDQILALTRK